jgi:hypothetical protein
MSRLFSQYQTEKRLGKLRNMRKKIKEGWTHGVMRSSSISFFTNYFEGK